MNNLNKNSNHKHKKQTKRQHIIDTVASNYSPFQPHHIQHKSLTVKSVSSVQSKKLLSKSTKFKEFPKKVNLKKAKQAQKQQQCRRQFKKQVNTAQNIQTKASKNNIKSLNKNRANTDSSIGSCFENKKKDELIKKVQNISCTSSVDQKSNNISKQQLNKNIKKNNIVNREKKVTIKQSASVILSQIEQKNGHKAQRTNNLMKNNIPSNKIVNNVPLKTTNKSKKNKKQTIDLSNSHSNNLVQTVNQKQTKVIQVKQTKVIQVKIQHQNPVTTNFQLILKVQSQIFQLSNLKMDNTKMVAQWQRKILIIFKIIKKDFQKSYSAKCVNLLLVIFSKSNEIYYTYAIDETRVFLIVELIKISVINYASIYPINLATLESVIQKWKQINIKTSLIQLSAKQFCQISQLIDFCFDELKQKTSIQKGFKSFQTLLWQTIFSFMQILEYNLCQYQFNFFLKNYQICSLIISNHSALILCSQSFITKATNYFRNKILPDWLTSKEVLLKNFFKITVSKTIKYLHQIQYLKNQANFVDMLFVQKKKLQFKLPLYDWSILSIKSRNSTIFKQIMKYCIQYFVQIYEDPATNTIRKTIYQNNSKKRNTIIEVPIQLQNSNQWNQNYEPMVQEKTQHLDTFCDTDMLNQAESQSQRISPFVSVQINCLLIYCNLLKMKWSDDIKHINNQEVQSKIKFQDTLEQKIYQDRIEVKDIEYFIFIVVYKEILQKLICEMQIIDPSLLNQDVCKGMMKLAQLCNSFKYQTNMQKNIFQIIKHQRYTKILQQSLLNQKKIISKLCTKGNFSQNKNRFSLKNNFQKHQFKQSKNRNTFNANKCTNQTFNPIQNQSWKLLIMKSCQNIFYQIQNMVQNTLPLLPIQHYEKQFAESPQIFIIQRFFPKMLQAQSIQHVTNFLKNLVTTQIKHRKKKLRMTDLIQYFNLFIQFCLKIRQQNYIGVFVRQLSNQTFLQFNQMVYQHNIDQKVDRKFHLPQLNKDQNKLALILSAGVYQKSLLVDRFFPEAAQQLLWRDLFKGLQFGNMQASYLLPKCFYGTIYYQFVLNKYEKQTITKLEVYMDYLSVCIDRGKLSQVCSVFHLLIVTFHAIRNELINEPIKPVLHNRKSSLNRETLTKCQSKDQNYFIMIQSLFFLIIQKQKRIIELYTESQQNQLKCIKNFNLTQQQKMSLIKNLQQYKKMHSYLLQNIVRFFQLVQISPRIVQKLRNPEEYIQIISIFCKKTGIFCFQIICKLSKISSNRVYHNLIQEKIKNKQYLRNVSDFYLLRNIAQNWMCYRKRQQDNKIYIKKSRSKNIKNEQEQKLQSIQFEQIIQLCLQMLERKIDATSERQILRCKVIALQIIKKLQYHLLQNSFQVILANLYLKKYAQRLRTILIQLIVRQKILTSKYEKQLILNIRIFVLFWMIQNYSKSIILNEESISVQIISQNEFWYLIFTLCFDEMIQMRISLLNACLSRFKNKQFKQFQKEKIFIWVIFMIMFVYEPSKKLKQLCKLTLSTIKKQVQNVDNLLFSILICLHFLVNFNYQQLIKTKTKKLNQNYFSQILSQLFIQKKQMEYTLFVIIANLLESTKYQIYRLQSSIKSNLTFYYLSNAGQYMHPKKQYFDLMDQLKSCDKVPIYQFQNKKQDQQKIPNHQYLFDKLCKQTLQAMIERVKQNGRTGRYVKSKKQIIIDWTVLQSYGIVCRTHN